MNHLKTTATTVLMLDYYGKDGLAEFLRDKYELKERAALFESNNDSCYVITVSWERLYDKDRATQIVDLLRKCNGIEYYYLETLMIDMLHKDWIIPGTYVISVSW